MAADSSPTWQRALPAIPFAGLAWLHAPWPVILVTVVFFYGVDPARQWREFARDCRSGDDASTVEGTAIDEGAESAPALDPPAPAEIAGYRDERQAA